MNETMYFLPHLLKTVEIFTKSSLDTVGDDVLVLTGFIILLSVEEPLRNIVLKRVVDDGNELIDLIVGEFTSTRHINQSN